MFRRLFVGCLALCVAGIGTPARALPSSPPSISIDVQDGSDSNSLFVTVTASAPHGTVTQIGLCAPDAGSCGSRPIAKPDVTEGVQACVLGDSKTYSDELHFPGPGMYTITASATSDGCPIVGGEQSSAESHDVTIAPPPPPPPPPPPIVCADSGTPASTDVGVTDTAVTLGATVVQSGPGAAVFGDAKFGIEAARNAINRSGGVCGRQLQVQYADDGGDSQRGSQYLHDMAQTDFAFVGVPDPTTLDAASESAQIDADGVPAVGTTGFAAHEFTDPSIYSVGGSPDGFGSVVVEHAYDAGARRFGIVTSGGYEWLTAAHDAVIAAVGRHDGASVASDVAIDPTQPSYSAPIQNFNAACAGQCDAVVYLVDPFTLLTWINGRPQMGSVENDLSPFAMNQTFDANCGDPCAGFIAWDPYILPIEQHAQDGGYVEYLHATNSSTDQYNAATEGAYVGTYLLARAIAAAGTDLTRAKLQQVLDSQSFTDPLVNSTLAWGSQRAPNRCLRPYVIQVTQGSFAGWRDDTGWLCAA